MNVTAQGLFGADGLLARKAGKLRRALARHPDHVGVLSELALVQRRQGDIAGALDTYRRLANLRPGQPLPAWSIAVLSGAGTRGMAPPRGVAPVPFVRRLGFLDPAQQRELLALVVAQRGRFVAARLGGGDGRRGVVDGGSRRALVATRDALRPVFAWLEPKLKAAAREALALLPVCGDDAHELQLNVTAHGAGDFFRVHRDQGEGADAGRRLTYVCYFHPEPRRFRGGDLLLHDTDRAAGKFDLGLFSRLPPEGNSLLFFPSDCFHEILPVRGGDGFAASRFAVSGWLVAPGG